MHVFILFRVVVVCGQDLMVGDEAAAQRAGLEVTYPVDNGVIRTWDDMELLWNYTFSYVTHAKRQWCPRVGVVLGFPVCADCSCRSGFGIFVPSALYSCLLVLPPHLLHAVVPVIVVVVMLCCVAERCRGMWRLPRWAVGPAAGRSWASTRQRSASC